ncbi:hypothetical protein [Ethanoligenens sp.]|uniref:hypothetical protein n=1 Tax=Ethanoligenens sp. TaxID=2099655 RepID=UPI0039E83944
MKRIRGKPKLSVKFLLIIIFAVLICTTLVSAAGNDTNQWPGGRIGYRLDTHYGQVAANAPAIPLYGDAACTQPISHYLLPGDWVVAYFNSDGSFAGSVTYPITVPQNGGGDDGLEYTTHYIHSEDLSYIVSGTGNFSGTDWNQTTWWNHLPTSIGYTSKLPGNGDTVWVGNNTDGGVGGGFNVYQVGNGYYELWSGDWLHPVMSASPSQFCYYDPSHTDYVNADYSWNLTSQPWNTIGLHQGYNLISYAGMDASGNYATGQRYLWWDTIAPDMATNLNNTQASFSHNGWLNLADLNGSDTYVVVSRDDTSQTTDVSGLNLASLQTIFDGVNQFGNAQGYQGFDYNDGTNWVKNMLLSATMRAMGVQSDGTGGQGTHSFQFSSIDNAWNTAVIGASVQIDTIPPTCSVSTTASDWKSGSAPITLDFEDPGAANGTGSGVSTAQYSWSQSQTDVGTWQNYTAGVQLTPPGDGAWYLHWQATDVAGNGSSGVFGPYSSGTGLSVNIQTPNAGYLTNEDVITSVIVNDSSATAVMPSDFAVMVFTAKSPNGSTYTTQGKATVCPQNGKNLIWFRWHTPSTAGIYTMTAALKAANATPQTSWTSTLQWNINVPTESTPPQTTYNDTKPSWFASQTPNPSGYAPSLTWSDWVFAGGGFQQRIYAATLNANLSISPEVDKDGSTRIATAYKNASGQWVMKSGYGINENVTSNVSITSLTSAAVDANSATPAQLTEGRYPEFNYWYAGYYRLFESLGNGKFDLQANKFSQYGFHSHYTPVWFPDGPYTVLTTTSQCWSPAGMLGNDQTSTIQIQGALPQDWYVRVIPYQ